VSPVETLTAPAWAGTLRALLSPGGSGTAVLPDAEGRP
jgi:hypothetical protein